MATKAQRVRVAGIDSTGCNGCMLAFSYLRSALHALLTRVDVVDFRLISSGGDTYEGGLDVAFWEGAITTEENRDRLLDVRKRTKTLVACGTCACTGGIPANVAARIVSGAQAGTYGIGIQELMVLQPKPIDDYVDVDVHLYGCPIRPEYLLNAIATLLEGGKLKTPADSVCVDCRLKENECIGEHGVCLGPITRGGICGAQCPSAGVACFGCCTLVPDANIARMLTLLTERGLSHDDAVRRIRTFNPHVFNEKEGEQE